MKMEIICVVLGVLLLAGFAASVSAQENVKGEAKGEAKVEDKVKDEVKVEVEQGGGKEVWQTPATVEPEDAVQKKKAVVRETVQQPVDAQAPDQKTIHATTKDKYPSDKYPSVDNPLSVGADFIVGGGTQVVLKNGVHLTVKGNLTNHGSVAFAGGSAVCLNGSGDQTLSGITAFDTLDVCSGGTLTLGTSATVSGGLVLTSGALSTGSNTITITNVKPNAVSIPTDGGSINGTITRSIAAGTRGLYQFTNDSTYLFLDGSLATPLNVTMTSYPSTFPPAGNTSAAIRHYYTITPSGALTAHKLSLAWDQGTENPHAVSVMDLILYRNSSGTYWNPEGGLPSTFDQATCHNVWVGPINQWSHWAIASSNAPLPIQLASFTGVELPGRGVRLNWRTVSEINNYGFYIQRKRMEDSLFAELPNVFIPGHGTTTEQHDYAFVDSLVRRGNWRFRLRHTDLSGAEFFTDAITVGVLTDVREIAPLVFALKQNYPNPFNPSTTIKFSVEKTDRATIDIYNILGQHVARLSDEIAEAGLYQKVRLDATNMASGTYIYRLQSGGRSEVRKLLLLK